MSTPDRVGPLAATIGVTGEGSEPSEAPVVIAPGGSIGRYFVLEELGRGGMGVVHAAYDPELDRKVAIKLMQAGRGRARDTAGHLRLQREAQAMAQLAHPNVIAVHDVGEWEGRIFVAMELVDGEDLGGWIETRRAWTEVLPPMVQAARGLLAAHEVGIVHRDFKPENCILGADGRVRVLDFGLAHADGSNPRPATGPRPAQAQDEQGSQRLTATGAVMGTPAYMAPEQHLGLPTTPQTDQFSFCVAMFRALYGHAPFAGETVATIMTNVVEGELQAPQDRRGVPGWLHRAVVRGLARHPEDRWPSMADLIRELDRLETARARRRWLGGVLAAVLAVGGAAYGVDAWRDRQARLAAEAREQAAAARLETLRPRLAEWLGQGSTEDATAAVEAFTRLPEIVGTTAEGAAWLTYAQLLSAPEHLDPRLQAAANAFASARSDTARHDVLVLLAETFRSAGRWAQLDATLLALGDTPSDPAIIAARAEAAMARRELRRAGELAGSSGFGPIAEHWAQAREVALPSGAASVGDIDGDGALELVVGGHGGDVEIRRMDSSLQVQQRIASDRYGDAFVLEGQQLVALSRGRPPNRYTRLFDVSGDTPRQLAEYRANVSDVATADLDGDGDAEHYATVAYYGRRLYRWDRDGERIVDTNPVREAERTHSDLNGVIAGDFDGDGQPELAVAAGSWKDYDVRIFEPDGAGLRRSARLQLGNIAGLRRLPGEVDRLVALKVDVAPSAGLFGPEQPFGPHPAGLYVLRQDGDAIVIDEHVEVPDAVAVMPASIHVGDFDGDGRDDVVVGAPGGMWVARQTDDGWAGAYSQGVVLRAVGQLDDDPALEALVHPHTKDRERTFVLGDGDAELPPVERRRAPPRDPPASIRASDLEQIWTNAETLVVMGLRPQAIGVFERIALLAEDEGRRAHALVRAAELAEADGDPVRARAIYERGLADESPSEDLVVAAARNAEHQHEFERALELWAGLQGPDAQAEVTRLRTLQVEARPLWTRGGSLPTGTRISRRLAVDWDERDSELLVRAEVGSGELLRVPLDIDGPRVGLELDLEIERAEWSSGIVVEIVDDEGAAVVQARLASGGAVRELHRLLAAGPVPARRWDVSAPGETTSIHLRLERTESTAFAQVSGPFEASTSAARPPLAPGRHALVIRALRQDSSGSYVFSARIPSIALRGATPVGQTLGPRDRAALAAALGRLDVDAVAPETIEDDDRVWWAVELDRAGRHTAASALLRGVGEPSTVDELRALFYLVRRDGGRLLPLLVDALGPVGTEVWREAWAFHVQDLSDPEVVTAIERDVPWLLGEAQRSEPRVDAGSLAVALSWRASLHELRAEYPRARRDYEDAVALAAGPEQTKGAVAQAALASSFAGLAALALLREDESAALAWVARAFESDVPAAAMSRALEARPAVWAKRSDFPGEVTAPPAGGRRDSRPGTP